MEMKLPGGTEKCGISKKMANLVLTLRDYLLCSD
jgi:hypothetical protein